MNIEKSKTLFERAKMLIPGQSQTFSKGPTQFVQGVSPIYCERGKGAKIWDVDGNEFTDYIMALGPIVLGYCFDDVDHAVIQQIKKGSIFSLPHHLEIDVAEELVNIIPSAEMVRFGKNGSDVTAAAIRISRAYTGKDKIAICGYHGWQDWYIGTTSRNLGVPRSTKDLSLTFNYNDIPSLEKLFNENPGQIACVIIEPIGIEEPDSLFLETVKELAHKNSAILIFDELKTGLRFALAGVQEYTGVIPDISTFGKAIANGYPLSAIVGKRDIMEYVDKTFFSFTFGGETLSLVACLKTIEIVQKKGVIKHNWGIGSYFKEKYNKLIKEYKLENYLWNKGYDIHFVTEFESGDGFTDFELKSLVHQEMVSRGNLTIGSYEFCYSHTKEMIDQTINDIDEILKTVTQAIKEKNVKKYLKGKAVKPIFRN